MTHAQNNSCFLLYAFTVQAVILNIHTNQVMLLTQLSNIGVLFPSTTLAMFSDDEVA